MSVVEKRRKRASPPRLSCVISEDLFERKGRLIPNGIEYRVMEVLLTDLLDAFERIPNDKKSKFWGAFLNRYLEITDYSPTARAALGRE